MQPVISVIIPTLNEGNYLPELLDDLKNQTKKDFEVFIVDGHSSDNTKALALKCKQDLTLHFVESSRKYPAFQRNLGAKKAAGEYLFFIDADSRMLPDAIEKADMHITKEHHALYLPVIRSENPVVKYRALIKFAVVLAVVFNKIGKQYSLGSTILIKKDLFEAIGGFNLETTIAEDHNLIISARKLGHRAHFVSDVRCLFSMRRFENDGIASVMWKYVLYSVETFFRGGVYQKAPNYEMGGHNYKKLQIKE